jgi:glutathione S-transferase
MVVPTLIDGDTKLFQSLTILEYLEEMHPEPPLLPPDPLAEGLGLRTRTDQRGRLAPSDRASCSALSS